jgi:predicted DNA-binding WGR domain protein
MRIVDSARLWFAEGNSDKVYEVDIVEVAVNQYVVNFRYGRRGSVLRDGTKTATPVALAKAQTVFALLIAEKRKGGYRDHQAATAVVAVASSGDPYRSAPTTTPMTDEAKHIIKRLGQGRKRHCHLDRDVRRAEYLGLAQAEPALLELMRGCSSNNDDAFAAGTIAALAHCGTAAAQPTLLAVVATSKRLHLLARTAAVIIAARHGDTTDVQRTIVRPLWTPDIVRLFDRQDAQSELLTIATTLMRRDVTVGLYLSHHAGASAAVRAVIRSAAMKDDNEAALVWTLYKLAALRRDGDTFALCARKIDDVESPTQAQLAIIQYFRRRTARTLRRLGSADSRDFVAMASAVLLSYSDHDAEPAFNGDYGSHWPAFARYHAVNYVIGESKSTLFRGHHRVSAWWQHTDGQKPAAPQDGAYWQLWQAQPDALWRLVRDGQLGIAIEYAGVSVRNNAAFTAGLSDRELGATMELAHPLGQHIAFDIGKLRPMSVDLGRGASYSQCDPAHQWVAGWAASTTNTIASSSEWFTILLCSNAGSLRSIADSVAKHHTVATDVLEQTTLQSIATLLSLTISNHNRTAQHARIADSCARLQRIAPLQLRALSIELLQTMIAHDSAGLGELAGYAILHHDHRAQLPSTLIEALLSSPHASVRLLGGKAVATTPVEVAKDNPGALVAFATSVNAELRQGTRHLLAAVAHAYPAVATRIAAELIEALQRAQPVGVPAHIISLLRNELSTVWPTMPAATIIRLINALSPHAREAGGMLLPQLGPDDIDLDTIARFAHHDILVIRQGAWQLARQASARYRVAPIALARLIDGPWQDARVETMSIVDKFVSDVGLETLGADAIITICDSIRPDVETFGKHLMLLHCTPANAEVYLRKLSEHPSVSVQLLVAGLLEHHAAGKPTVIAALLPYFAVVLSHVNRGKIAKLRVIEFIRSQCAASEAMATILTPLLDRQSATIAVSQKQPLIATMTDIASQFPDVQTPLTLVPIAPLPQRGSRGI